LGLLAGKWFEIRGCYFGGGLGLDSFSGFGGLNTIAITVIAERGHECSLQSPSPSMAAQRCQFASPVKSSFPQTYSPLEKSVDKQLPEYLSRDSARDVRTCRLNN
jgi:hypothetical protein